MRITSRIFVVLLALTVSASFVLAQQTRVAYIDASKLLKRLPDAKDAQARLDQLTSSWSKEASDIQSELDRKQADYDHRKLIMTDAERGAAELDLSNLRKKHDDFMHQKFDLNGGELFQQQAQLMKPAYDKLTAAIKEAAEDGKFDYVIDRSSKDVVLIYTNYKFDLTVPVARKLGIESEILTTPLVNNAPKPGGTAPNTQSPHPQKPGVNQNPINPALPSGLIQPQPQPGLNSGSVNPDQLPPPPAKEPAVVH